MNRTSNAAYEYERFEEHSRVEIKILPPRPKAERRVGVLRVGCYLACAVLMLSVLIYARVEQTELINEYEQYTTWVNTKKGENARLQVQIEQMLSQESITEIAREEIGLNTVRSQQIEYVEFDSEIRTEVIEARSFWDKLWSSIQSWVQGLF